MSLTELKKVSELNRTEKAAVMILALQKEGYSQADISRFLEVSRAHVSQVNKKIKKGSLSPYVGKARKAIKLILEGKAVGNVRDIRASDVLTAAKMVIDRSDPITVKTENTNIRLTVDITPDDRDKYKKALGIPIDAEFTVVEPVLIPEQKLIESIEVKENESEHEPERDSEAVPVADFRSLPY